MVKALRRSKPTVYGCIDQNVLLLLDHLPVPRWLIEGGLQDNEWVIATDDPSKRRNTEEKIHFHIPIGVGPVWLTDPCARHDLLTAKLYVYYSLSHREGWNTSANAAALGYRYLTNFIRWKWNQGIEYTANLTPVWLEKYKDSLVRNGLEGLLQSEERIAHVLAQFRVEPKLTPTTIRRGRKTLLRSKVYELAGLSQWLQLSDSATNLIDDFCVEHGLFVEQKPQPASSSLGKVGTRNIQKSNLHPSHLAGYLAVWQRLWLLAEKLDHDRLGFEPFEDRKAVGVSAGQLSNRISVRTPTAPPEQTCFLIDRSIRWVLLYSRDLRKFVDRVEDGFSKPFIKSQADAVAYAGDLFKPKFNGKNHPSAPWPIENLKRTPKYKSDNIPLYTALFSYLPAACAVVIAAFTARRREEIESLKAGSISIESGDYLLEVWIEKTLRRFEKIPVPNIVATAIEVLEWLSIKHRQRLVTEWLFEFDTLIPYLGERRTVGFKFGSALQEFSRFIDVPRLPDGKDWHFTPHQFRRFFAITYFYRYRDSSLSALSEYLKHFNPETTRQYITDNAQGSLARMAEENNANLHAAKMMAENSERKLQDFDDVALGFRSDILSAVHKGTMKLAGFGGEALAERFNRQVQAALRGLRVGAGHEEEENTLNHVFVTFARSFVLEPKAPGHSYCKCSTSQMDLSVALCVKKADGNIGAIKKPDNRFAVDTTCAKCPHNVQLPENEPYWRELIEELVQRMNDSTSALSRLHNQQRLAIAKGLYERCFVSSSSGHSS